MLKLTHHSLTNTFAMRKGERKVKTRVNQHDIGHMFIQFRLKKQHMPLDLLQNDNNMIKQLKDNKICLFCSIGKNSHSWL